MKIDQLGKKFIVEVAGTRLTAEEKAIIEELQPAGFMFRKRNFLQNESYQVWLKEYQQLIDELRITLPDKKLILSIDHEGGLIIRPPLPITRFPYPFYWQDQTIAVSQAIAVELKSLGINLNFAPVADIHSNPNNPVINDRAFACFAPEVIAKMVLFMEQMYSLGIACCAKHFPGHGNASSDSHIDLPYLESTLEELEACELQPFQAAINHRVPAIMPGHLNFPKIDPKNFTTFSKFFLTDLLRDKMGFTGITIADAFSMAPAKAELFKPEMVARACNAGLDIFSIVGPGLEITDALIVRDLIWENLQAKQISEVSLQVSIQRIDKFIGKLSNFDIKEIEPTILTKHKLLAERLTPKKLDRMKDIIVSK